MKVSRPIQILVLILVLAGVGGIASMSMLGKSSASDTSAPQPSVAQIRARAHHTTVAQAPAKAPVAHKVQPNKAHTNVKTPAAPATPAKPKAPRPTVAANGLPIVLADALHAHRVVVVSVFDPQDRTDAISYAEARAGAGDAGAGFLGVSVLDDTVTSPLTTALPGGGLLPVPGLLVYRAPGVLIQRIDGFADRDAVAQVAAAARTATPLTTPATTTAVPTAAAPVAAAPVSTP